jgi:hypothetical protein
MGLHGQRKASRHSPKQLDSIVAIGLGLLLDDGFGPLEDGDGNGRAVLGVELGHAELLAEQFDGHGDLLVRIGAGGVHRFGLVAVDALSIGNGSRRPLRAAPGGKALPPFVNPSALDQAGDPQCEATPGERTAREAIYFAGGSGDLAGIRSPEAASDL